MKATPMIVTCVECKWCVHDLETPLAKRRSAHCSSPHTIVVGDGMNHEGRTPCWMERSVIKPGEHAFHCGPNATYFEPKGQL